MHIDAFSSVTKVRMSKTTFDVLQELAVAGTLHTVISIVMDQPPNPHILAYSSSSPSFPSAPNRRSWSTHSQVVYV